VELVGYNQLAKVICIACSEPLGEHSKKGLVRCLFRIQGTLVSDGIENTQSQYSDEDIADARNEGHIDVRGFDRGVG
tara:strand:- start:8663 stop:8893 length:231 start_codon:yes stop_codon:yes gene_type:complete